MRCLWVEAAAVQEVVRVEVLEEVDVVLSVTL